MYIVSKPEKLWCKACTSQLVIERCKTKKDVKPRLVAW